MNKVVPFKDSIVRGQPDPEIVEKLEELLEDARAGHIIGFAYIATRGEDMPFTYGWLSNMGDGHRISTCIMKLSIDYAQSWPEG